MMESPNTITANVQVNQISIQAKSKGLSTPPANIVVVGGGLAGFCAVIEAQKKGAIVTLLEKQNLVGGNSAKASSGINGLNTFAQELKGIVDTFTTFKADTVRSGGGLSEQTLVDMLVSSSTEAINWLHSVFNFNLVDLVQLGGHSFPRTHRFPSKDGKPIPVGWTLVSILKAHIETLSSVSIMRNANMTRLLTKNDDGDISVTGIEYEMEGSLIEMPCDAVILTTGGFAFDRGEGSLLREFAPSKLYLPTTSGPQADGAAIRIARRDAQAELVHMEYVQIHPTGFVDPNDPSCPSKILAPEALRGCGGVLLSYEGKRFCDELGTRDYVTARVQASSPSATPDKPALSYLVMNEDATTAFGKAALSFYMNRNLVQQCVGADEVAKYIKCNKENVLKTLSEIDLVSKGKIYDPHGRIVFPTYNWNPSQTFTVATVTPCIHYTMGGISINASAEVHARPFKIGSGPRIGGFASTPIVLGLYAAGECTGGVHGANRLAGNSLLECVVFGRTAGMRAADITLSSLPALNTEQYQPLRLQCRRTLSARGHIHEFTFDLPSTRHRLAPYFKTGQYISLRHWPEKASSTPVERFYSPISRDGTRGKLVLLIKAEPNRNEVQESLCNMKPGDMVEVKGPYGGLNFDLFDSSVERIGLIAGGSGVSPMVQIIRECLFTGAQKYIRLLWGVEYAEDLVYRKIMDEQARLHPDILNVTYIVNKPDFGWVGETGMIDASLIQRHMFRPGPGTKIVICGPYKMCLKMKVLLQELGYCDEMVYSFM